MSLEKLLEKINEKDQEVLKKIVEDANSELANLQKAFDAVIANYSKSAASQVEVNLQFLQKQAENNLEIYQKKTLLELKSKILNNVYENFRTILNSWDLKNYETWILKTIKGIDFLSKTGELVVGIGSFASNIDDNFKKNVCDSLAKLGLQNVKLSFTSDFEFGLKYLEKSTIIDESLEVLMSLLREENELILTQILFSSEV